MAEVKKTVAVKETVSKPVTEVKVPVEVKTPEVKAPEVKKETPKKTSAKKAAAKKSTNKKTAAVKAATVKQEAKTEIVTSICLQYGSRSYTEEELLKMAKDVWTFDLNNKAEELQSVTLYVKPEENMVYYVMNEMEGGFSI